MTQPLTALRGTIEVALLPGNKRADLEQSLHSGMWIIQALVDDFTLLKEVVESTDPGDHAENVRWDKLIRTAAAKAAHEHPQRQIRVSVQGTANSRVRANASRLLKATEDCMRLAITFSPAESPIDVNFIRKGRALILTVKHDLRLAPAPGETGAAASVREEELRLWILCRAAEAQGGTLRVDSLRSGKRSLTFRMPATEPQGR